MKKKSTKSKNVPLDNIANTSDDAYVMEYDDIDNDAFFFKPNRWGAFMFDAQGKSKVKELIKSLRKMEQASAAQAPLYYPMNVAVTFHPPFAKKLRKRLEEEMREGK
ncbi:MAG: hypothetical protein A2W23_07060 [Planctomycetes bacterium RBG_16_43_13]|nr:MAG: hypothetical protein A2W23_07060 [Planctomycetes bacterium RBG_16_43_13]